MRYVAQLGFKLALVSFSFPSAGILTVHHRAQEDGLTATINESVIFIKEPVSRTASELCLDLTSF